MLTREIYMEKLLKVTELLTSSVKEIMEKIEFFAANPAAFLSSEYSDYCSFEEDDLANLPDYPNVLVNTYYWDIFYGILNHERFIIRLDHRTSHQNILWAVNLLLERRGLQTIASSELFLDKNLPSWEVLNILAAWLEKRGLTLAFVYDGSDSFPLLLVNKEVLSGLVDTASLLGLDIKTHFS